MELPEGDCTKEDIMRWMQQRERMFIQTLNSLSNKRGEEVKVPRWEDGYDLHHYFELFKSVIEDHGETNILRSLHQNYRELC